MRVLIVLLLLTGPTLAQAPNDTLGNETSAARANNDACYAQMKAENPPIRPRQEFQYMQTCKANGPRSH